MKKRYTEAEWNAMSEEERAEIIREKLSKVGWTAAKIAAFVLLAVASYIVARKIFDLVEGNGGGGCDNGGDTTTTTTTDDNTSTAELWKACF